MGARSAASRDELERVHQSLPATCASFFCALGRLLSELTSTVRTTKGLHKFQLKSGKYLEHNYVGANFIDRELQWGSRKPVLPRITHPR
jgi:hypothetical protein